MTTNSEDKLFEIVNWRQLIDYVNYLNGNNDHQIKICLIDEENEEIRVETEEEFQQNVDYAKEKGFQSLKFLIYANNLFKFDGIFHLNRVENFEISKFPSDKFVRLREKVLPTKWYIPVKSDEDFGVCLSSSIEILRENQLENHPDCRTFLDLIVPDAFRKLQTSQSVFTWPRDIHQHIFELLVLFVDLVRLRIEQKPLPNILLETLSTVFDPNTTFSQKHKTDALPNGQIFLNDENFLRRSADSTSETFLWTKFLIERFFASTGLTTFLRQFESIVETKDQISLLKLFAKSHSLIVAERFRTIFSFQIRRSIEFLLERKRIENSPSENLKELNEILLEICVNFDMAEEINQLLQIVPTPPAPKVKKPKHKDLYERLAENVRDMTLKSPEEKEKEKEKRGKTKKRRRLMNSEKSSTSSSGSFDRSNGDEILRYFGPMKIRIGELYDELDNATRLGNIRQVLKIEEKLKLLRPFSARFIADENTPDGTVMQPGETFRKSWILLNDGSMPWSNDDVQLVCLTETIEMLDAVRIPIAAPHDRTTISVDLKCPLRPGIYESKWILSYRNRTFGPMIWCSIEVRQTDFIDVPLPDCFDLSKPFLRPASPTPTTTTTTSYEQLIDVENENENETNSPPPLNFVDAVVTNFFSAAKHAGSTAKAIFNTLQANDVERKFTNEPMDLLVDMGFVDRDKNQRLLNENRQDLTKVIEILSFETNPTADWFFN